MKQDLGHAQIAPQDPVQAGSLCTLVYTYTTGHPIDDTGGLRIVFRYAGDFGTPQFDDPAGPNFASVRTTGGCRIEPAWATKGNLRPWGQTFSLRVMGGFLDRGDRIVVTFGDRSEGSPGWQMQTFCEETFEFKTLVDPIATGRFEEVSASPTVTVVPGPPVRAIAVAPSQVVVGRSFDVSMKLEDAWGNPVALPSRIGHPGFGGPGIERVTVKDESSGLSARTHPIRVTSEETHPKHYWADFHGQSEETIGTNSIHDYFLFARDFGLLDIAAHQGNDFQITDRFWEEINRETEEFNDPGTFVTFPGYEWSGNTPLGGDRNVYFASEGESIFRSSFELLPEGQSAYASASTAAELFRKLRRTSSRAFAFAHVGGRYADLRMHDDDIEIAVEIHSAWGTFEWLAKDALRRGFRVGFCANSDGHKGRPGASYPGASRFGAYGGLTCVLADRLDREAVLAALLNRRFYATTGHRGLLRVLVETETGEQAAMGAVVRGRGENLVLHVQAAGTAPIERVDVLNGPDEMTTLRPYGTDDLGARLKVLWSGAHVRGRDRMVIWDGQMRIRGNRVLEVHPVNFLNPARPLIQVDSRTIEWKSVTTGGAAGCILALADPLAGELALETAQGTATFSIENVGLTATTRAFGGLDKAISLYRLPDRLDSMELAFALPLHDLHPGVNPIYVRVVQEDGHISWSSPIYVT